MVLGVVFFKSALGFPEIHNDHNDGDWWCWKWIWWWLERQERFSPSLFNHFPHFPHCAGQTADDLQTGGIFGQKRFTPDEDRSHRDDGKDSFVTSAIGWSADFEASGWFHWDLLQSLLKWLLHRDWLYYGCATYFVTVMFHILFYGLNYFIKFSAANRDGIFEALPQGLVVLKCSDCFIEGVKSSICNHQSISMAL